MVLGWIGSLGLCLFLSLGTSPLFAQVNLVVSPIRVERQLPPGEAETDIIHVRNEGRQPLRLRAYLEDWRMDSQGNITHTRPGENPRSCYSWIQINPRDFRVEPGQSREVRYTLTVPQGASPGTYWSAIIFEALPPQGKHPIKEGIGVYGRVAVVVYETVGQPDIQAQLQNFQVSQERPGLVFKLTLANPGTGFVRLRKSWILVKDARGQEVRRVEIPDIPIMPGGSRELEFKENLPLAPGEYQAEAVVDVGRRELLGKRQAFTVGR